MNQTVDILCRARELYASAPSHARLPDHPDWRTYCVATAALKAAVGRFEAVDRALDLFADVVGTTNIVAWNAEHSTAEVLAAFDRAIAAQRLVVPPLQRAERRDPVHAGQES